MKILFDGWQFGWVCRKCHENYALSDDSFQCIFTWTFELKVSQFFIFSPDHVSYIFKICLVTKMKKITIFTYPKVYN